MPEFAFNHEKFKYVPWSDQALQTFWGEPVRIEAEARVTSISACHWYLTLREKAYNPRKKLIRSEEYSHSLQ